MRKEITKTIELTEGEMIIIREAMRGYGYTVTPKVKDNIELYSNEINSIDNKMTKLLSDIFDEKLRNL